MTHDLQAQVQALATLLLTRGERLCTAESCTGGMIAARCTDLAGSSAWFERGMVSYSNEAKHELLGVPTELITAHGAVSEPVARAMALGALAHAHADWAVAVTGVAGPSGGSAAKPVGTVWLAWAHAGPAGAAPWVQAERHHFDGGRAAVRHATVGMALHGLIQRMQDPPTASA